MLLLGQLTGPAQRSRRFLGVLLCSVQAAGKEEASRTWTCTCLQTHPALALQLGDVGRGGSESDESPALTNLLGLAVRPGQRVLGKQNHSTSVTPGATPGPPASTAQQSPVKLSPRQGARGLFCIRQTWKRLDWHILWMQLSLCLPLPNQ